MFNTFIAQIFCGALGVAFVNGMSVEGGGGGLSRVVLNVMKFRINARLKAPMCQLS